MWRSDLQFLLRELPMRHANLYRSISKDEFLGAAARLNQQIPDLTDNQVIVEFARLTALVGDGHTGLFFPFDDTIPFHKYPFEVWAVSDGYIVAAASPDLTALVGKKLVRFGNEEISKVIAAVAPLAPGDNLFGKQNMALMFLPIPEVLEALAIIPQVGPLPVTVMGTDGALQTVTVQPVANDYTVPWHNPGLQMMSPPSGLPLWLRRRAEKYWYEYLPDSKALYVQNASSDVGPGTEQQEFEHFCDQLVAFGRSHDVKKMIVDLRWNDGGSSSRTQCLWQSVIRLNDINQKERMFVVTSPTTFSAAEITAARFENFTRALFVGQPTGGSPNACGELRRLTLPGSGITVRYSAYYYMASSSNDDRPAIMPELRAQPSWNDYVEGRDPAMDAILQYATRRSIVDVLDTAIQEKGLEYAIAYVKNLDATQWNAYEFDDEQLLELGNKLIEKGKSREAIAVLQMNVELHPYSSDARFALAEAYASSGEKAKAVESYRKTFEMDKAYSQALDKAYKLEK
jgi:Peptidase family S41/Bacterial transcriptional activator domain